MKVKSQTKPKIGRWSLTLFVALLLRQPPPTVTGKRARSIRSHFDLVLPRAVDSGKMRGMRILNNALSKMVNAERRGTATTNLQPVSKVMADFLGIMKKRGYIKDYEVTDIHRVGKITVKLAGRLTDCRALTYRQDIKAKDIREYRLRTLPTKQWGYIVVRTPEGIVDHDEAIEQNIGGQVLGYFY